MTKQFIQLNLFVAFLFFQTNVHSNEDQNKTVQLYGNKIPEAGAVITLKSAIENISSTQNQLQKISGTVTKVCRKKGCWMILTDNNNHARITFKDYEFFVPPSTGRVNAVVYGKLSETKLSEKLAKHYAQDEGKSGAHIKGSSKEYSIVASGVYLDAVNDDTTKQ